MNTKLLVILGVLLLIGISNAVPVTGVAFDVTSNSFTVPVVGVTGDGWIAWGQSPGNTNWASSTQTGDGNYIVWGAPILGGTTVYYKACDNTGCGNELSVSITSITPLPVPTFGAAYSNLSARHFQIVDIPRNLLPGYLATGVTTTVLWGIIFFFIFFGFWFRTRSVRMSLIIGFLMAAFILSPTAGLMLGAPLVMQIAAQGIMALCIAGILLAFIKK